MVTTQLSEFHRRLAKLVLVMVVVVSVVTAWTLYHLYQVHYDEDMAELAETARTTTSLINAVARFDQQYSVHPQGSWEATLEQLRAGFSPTISGETDIVLGQRRGDDIVFVWRQRAAAASAPLTIPFDSDLAVPMQRALRGQTGTVTALDYDGREVMAAYQPIPALDLGLVVKRNLSDVRMPFLQSGVTVAVVAVAAMLLGIIVFLRAVAPVAQTVAQSERRLRDIFETVGSGVVIYQAVNDGDDFIIRDFNRAAERIEKVAREDVIGLRLSEAFPGTIEMGLMGVLKRVWKTGDSEELTATFYQDDRHQGWRENTVYRMDSGDVVAIYDDITEQKAAETALRESLSGRDRLAEIVSNSPAVVYLFRAVDGWPAVYVSENVSQFGYAQNDFLSGDLSFTNIVYEEDLPWLQKENQRYAEQGQDEFSQHYRIVTKDGDVRWLDDRSTALRDETGTITHYQGVVIDITQHKKAEQALAEAEERFALAMQGTNEGLWDWNVASGQTYYSPRWKSMLGYAEHEITNDFSEWQRRVHPDDLPRALKNIDDYVAGRVKTFELEFRMRHKDGGWVHILARAHGVWNDEGNLVRLVGTHVDITPLKVAQSHLEREKEKAERYLDIAGSMIIVLAQDGTIDIANKATHQVLGYDDKALIGRNWFDIAIPDEEREDLLAVHKKLIAGHLKGIDYVESHIITATGEHRLIAWRNAVLSDGQAGATRSLSSGADITEQRKREQALARANRALTTISACNEVLVHAQSEAELLGDICKTICAKGEYPLAWVGFKDDGPDKAVIPAHAAGPKQDYLKTLNLSWSDTAPTGHGPTGTSIRTGTPAVVRDVDNDPHYAPWRAQANAFGFKSSISLPLKLEGEVIGSLCIYARQPDAFDEQEVRLLTELVSDLSYGLQSLRSNAKRIAAEKALGISTVQLKTIMDRNMDALVVVDEQGLVRFANPAAETLFGRPLMGDNGGIPLGIPTGGRKWQRMDIVKPDHEIAVADVSSVPIPWEAEQNSYLFVIRDITTQLEMQRTIDNLERMEALGELAGGIVHDIKNMLLPIITLSEMNANALPKGSRERKRAEKVVEAANRVKDLAIGLLAFSRRKEDEVVRETVSIHAVLRSTLELIQASLPTSVSISTDLDENAGRISVEVSRFADAVINLATNAADSMEGGIGEINIVSERVEIGTDNVPNVLPAEPGSYVRLAFTDTGKGMDEATLRKAFAPFFTTKSEGHGTGLGLPMVMGFARHHGAGLSAHSTPGQGTTFEIFFPLVDDMNSPDA